MTPTDEVADREVADDGTTDEPGVGDLTREWAGGPVEDELRDEPTGDERAVEPEEAEPTGEWAEDELAEDELAEDELAEDELAEDELTGELAEDELAEDELTGELAEDDPADDEGAWPGVAPAAGWFLRAPDEERWADPTEGDVGATRDGAGATPGRAGETPPGANAAQGGASTAQGGASTAQGGASTAQGGSGETQGGSGETQGGSGAVPWPRQAPDAFWSEPSGSPVSAPPNGVEAASGTNTGNGARPTGAWTVPSGGPLDESVVGATRALWGRAGGPGFQPGRPGPGARRVAAEPSPWQKSQGLWRNSGIQWEQRAAESAPQPQPAAPASSPRRDPRPSPLPPRRILAAPLPAPVVPLGAPAFADTQPEPRNDRRALRVDDEPPLPGDSSLGWDRSFGWQRVSATQDLFPPGSNRRGGHDTALLETELPATWRPDPRRNRGARRTAAIVVPVIVLVAVAILAFALLTGHGPRFGQLTSGQPREQAPALPQALAAAAFGIYPGQQQRGVYQTINRVVSSGNTIVTMGSQTSDGVVRQQFFVSTNAGASWRIAPVQAPGGGLAPVGHRASLLAGGPGGWVAIGPQALWTSPDGQSWTLAATHGVTPQLPGDSIWVITRTAQGFVAAGSGSAGRGASQAVIWTSPDGVNWHRATAAQLGLAAAGEQVENISHAAWLGTASVISGEVAAGGTVYSGAWLSTDGGASWTRVTVPSDHGAGASIAGLAFDSAGLIAVRPGRSASGTADGVAYFSPNGRAWQYAGTIDAAGGWTPGVVKGSVYGFVATGTDAGGRLVAYTSTGNGASWQPTAPLGQAGDESLVGATVGPAGTVIAVGYSAASNIGQQAVLVEANTAGSVRPVSLADLPGGVIPELAVNGLAVAGSQQVAVGSADGYPAVWQKASGNSWALVTSLASVRGVSGLRALTGVTHSFAGWLAVGAPGPYVATSADGTTWQFATGPGSITDDLAGVSALATAAGPAGYVIVGKLIAAGGSCVADVWWSPNLTFWVRAHDVNDATGSSQVLAVAANAHGFVSAGSHDGRPAVWTTTDGPTWRTIVLPMPAGATGAVLQQIAISGDRVVALGQEATAAGPRPIAELSVDGGNDWQQVPFGSPGPDPAFTALTAGPGGFAAAGQFGEPGQGEVGAWTSANGTVWAPAQIAGLTGAQAGGSYLLTALAPAGSAVTGVGSIATQQSLEPFIVTIPAG